MLREITRIRTLKYTKDFLAMKYTPKIYARAFVEVFDLAPEKQDEMLRNFLSLIRKNNDQHLYKKIYQQTEKLARGKSGKRKVVVETARPVKNDDVVKKIVKNDDIVEKRINPDLIAGVKIVVDDERQFDGSMAKKIKSLFS